MSDPPQVQRVHLERREMVVIDDARGQIIACESGELWITQDGDRRDIILTAGASWRIERRGPLVLSALEPSVASLRHPAGGPVGMPRRDGAASLLALIRRWRFPALASFPARFII